MRVEASAPSNIALIKYMGKSSTSGNRPANVSLSYTLEHLRSFVVIEELSSSAPCDEWAPLEGFPPIELSSVGREKFLRHFKSLKSHFGISGFHRVRSANNFPSDCGLASSASSFAALTRAAASLAPDRRMTPEELSALSRVGSGSSCRSFFSPWAKWSGEHAEPVKIDMKLEHAVIVVDGGKKQVSSSEAHQRIPTSSNWPGRLERAERRYSDLTTAFQSKDWQTAFAVTWAEFWDMHALFETSRPPFGYMVPETLAVLNRLRQVWKDTGDGPLVTMDAGANVHILLRPDQVPNAKRWLEGLHSIRSWHE